MRQRLPGRVAIVTGAGRGIGRGEALLLAQEGAAVVVNDFGGSGAGAGGDRAPADEVVEEIRAAGGQAVANYGDIALFQTGQELVQQALDMFGRLDIIVNNAGIVRVRAVHKITEDEWDSVMMVHLKGHFNLTHHACVVFRQQRSGVIVNTSSESGLGIPGQANYSAAKEGIVGFTRTVARDMGRYGVRCNAIRPRAATRLTINEATREAARWAHPTYGSLAALQAFERVNPPQAVAPLVVWLCTDEAAHVNGRTFLVGGDRIGLYSEPEVIAGITSDRGWTLDEISRLMPERVTKGVVNRFVV